MLCHILIIIEHAVLGAVSRSNPDTAITVDLACLGGLIEIMCVLQSYFIAFYVQTVSPDYMMKLTMWQE